VLKGKFRSSSRGIFFRKAMVVVQFAASVILVVGTFTVYRQLSFMRNQDLGLNIDQTVVLRSPLVIDSTYRSKFSVLKNRFEQLPGIISVSASSVVPGQSGDNAGGIRRLSQTDEEQNQYRFMYVDADYISSYQMKMVAGRSFSATVTGEERSAIVNESGFRLLGFDTPEEAINESIFFWGDTLRIVGVLKNFHHESVKKAFEPLIFRYAPAPQGAYSVKISTTDVAGTMREMEDLWKEIFPGNPFNYQFLDEFFDRQYQADRQFGKVFTLFSLLATFIACLGLFGLSSLTAIQRTKEIGVRKVLGASVPGILMLMSRDYLFLLGVSIATATPLAWWIMSGWLEGFATRIPLSWAIFAIPSALVIAIALLTAGVHTLRAAQADPVKALRYE
jgi:putative ABC transport system permease protein